MPTSQVKGQQAAFRIINASRQKDEKNSCLLMFMKWVIHSTKWSLPRSEFRTVKRIQIKARCIEYLSSCFKNLYRLVYKIFFHSINRVFNNEYIGTSVNLVFNTALSTLVTYIPCHCCRFKTRAISKTKKWITMMYCISALLQNNIEYEMAMDSLMNMG